MSKRYEIGQVRRTARFTVWDVFDTHEMKSVPGTNSRDRDEVKARMRALEAEHVQRVHSETCEPSSS